MEVLGQAVSFHFQINIADYTEQVFCSGMKIILPFLALCLLLIPILNTADGVCSCHEGASAPTVRAGSDEGNKNLQPPDSEGGCEGDTLFGQFYYFWHAVLV